jgi:hypothetical protein
MGEDLLYSRLSPWGKSCYIASFPGGKATMGEKLLYNTFPVLPLSGSASEIGVAVLNMITTVDPPLRLV